MGELNSCLPHTDGNIHIPVCKELSREFGSAKLVQAAMVSAEETFVEAVVKILKAQLQKTTRDKASFVKKVRRFSCKRPKKMQLRLSKCDIVKERLKRCLVLTWLLENLKSAPSMQYMFNMAINTAPDG